MSSEISPGASAAVLVARLLQQTLGVFDVMSVYLGDRLGLYRCLRDDGPATPPELASRAGIHPRYAREWLEQQAVTGLLEVDDVATDAEARRYTLPDAFVAPLLDPDSPMSIAPLARAVVATAVTLPQLVEAYRSGSGFEWADYGADMIESQGDFNRPWLRGRLGSEMLPAMPDIHARLTADPPARVADVACGVGWAAIAIASAYPNVTVDGFDLDPSSIALATENARVAGVSDRVTFAVRDAADPSASGRYDLAVIIEAVHDVSRPVEVLAAMRRMLAPGGTVLVADEKTADTFTAPGDEAERIFYGFSIFTCLPAAMDDPGTAATGAVIRESTMRRYATDAGFASFRRIDDPTPELLRFYQLSG